MRFYKSVKICKGVKIGVSKSGLRLGVGIPGLSISTGTKGIFLNTGIPGTGLSNRMKIAGGGSTKRKSSKKRTKVVRESIRIHMENDGTITFFDSKDNLITDESLIRKFKRHPEYANVISTLRHQIAEENTEKANEINANNEEIIDICQLSEDVYNMTYYQNLKSILKPEEYEEKHFKISKPDKEEIKVMLKEEAQNVSVGWKFWQKAKLQDDYIQQNLDERYDVLLSQWYEKKNRFEIEEEKRKREFENRAKEIYKEQMYNLEKAIAGNEEYINNQINSMLLDMELPLDFSVQYETFDCAKIIYVDLDLPEIEMLPDEKATMLANGTVKMKKKSQAELKQDYVQCVFGFAIFFASKIFNISPCVEKVVVSGYTQRRNNKGDLNDDYIYSIKFVRKGMEGVDLKDVNPYDFCMNFENRSNKLKSGILKCIEPFGE